MKKGFKIGLIIIIFLYLILFFSYKNGYYRTQNMEKRILTDEKIKEYENDLANGIDVTNKEYVVINEHYDNIYTRFTLKLSKQIENTFQKAIKFFFSRISRLVND